MLQPRDWWKSRNAYKNTAYLGPAARSNTSYHLDAIVLLANVTLTALSIMLNRNTTVLATCYVLVSVVVAVMHGKLKPYTDPRMLQVVLALRFVFAWTCIVGLYTTVINDSSNEDPAKLYYPGMAACCAFPVLFAKFFEWDVSPEQEDTAHDLTQSTRGKSPFGASRGLLSGLRGGTNPYDALTRRIRRPAPSAGRGT